MIEAYAAPGVQSKAPFAIVARSPAQLNDPHFRALAARLGEALQARGFTIVVPPQLFSRAVTLDYQVRRQAFESGPASFPVYRRITVTAYDISDRAHARVAWRTALEEDGFDDAVDHTIPALISAGQPYDGRDMTALAVADCDDFGAAGGKRIASLPCAPLRAAMADMHVGKRPQVVVETSATRPPPPE